MIGLVPGTSYGMDKIRIMPSNKLETSRSSLLQRISERKSSFFVSGWESNPIEYKRISFRKGFSESVRVRPDSR